MPLNERPDVSAATLFDYGQLEFETQAFVREHAETIRARAKQTAENIVLIGEDLVAVKRRLEHGKWLPWLQSEFGWTDRTAERFIQVYELVKSDKLSNLPSFDVSALYLLAAPSTPEPVRQITARLAASGQKVTHKLVKQQIALVKTMAVEPAFNPQVLNVTAEPIGELYAEPVASTPDQTYERLRHYLYKARSSVPAVPSTNELRAIPQQRRDDLRGRAERVYAWVSKLLQGLHAADKGED